MTIFFYVFYLTHTYESPYTERVYKTGFNRINYSTFIEYEYVSTELDCNIFGDIFILSDANCTKLYFLFQLFKFLCLYFSYSFS